MDESQIKQEINNPDELDRPVELFAPSNEAPTQAEQEDNLQPLGEVIEPDSASITAEKEADDARLLIESIYQQQEAKSVI